MVTRSATILCALALLAGCGSGDEEPGATTTLAEPPQTIAPPKHAVLSGPHYDGAISDLSDTELTLHLLPERPERPEVTFTIPDPPPPGVDLEHLRADASAGVDTRIFYRRRGGRLVLRGYTHPPRPAE